MLFKGGLVSGRLGVSESVKRTIIRYSTTSSRPVRHYCTVEIRDAWQFSSRQRNNRISRAAFHILSTSWTGPIFRTEICGLRVFARVLDWSALTPATASSHRIHFRPYHIPSHHPTTGFWIFENDDSGIWWHPSFLACDAYFFFKSHRHSKSINEVCDRLSCSNSLNVPSNWGWVEIWVNLYLGLKCT